MKVGDKYKSTDMLATIKIKIVEVFDQEVAVKPINLPESAPVKIPKVNLRNNFKKIIEECEYNYYSEQKSKLSL